MLIKSKRPIQKYFCSSDLMLINPEQKGILQKETK